jgi:hypothetical protein
MECFRIEGSEGSKEVLRVTHEDLELSDAERAEGERLT